MLELATKLGTSSGSKLPKKPFLVLFTGPNRRGKTAAAEMLAKNLDLPLYRVDLGKIVSTYIRETEKNLAEIFDAAESADYILFFDEADALFGDRSEVEDAHDRYKDLALHLLKRLKENGGVFILALSHRRRLDRALNQRVRFVVDFPTDKPE